MFAESARVFKTNTLHKTNKLQFYEFMIDHRSYIFASYNSYLKIDYFVPLLIFKCICFMMESEC